MVNVTQKNYDVLDASVENSRCQRLKLVNVLDVVFHFLLLRKWVAMMSLVK